MASRSQLSNGANDSTAVKSEPNLNQSNKSSSNDRPYYGKCQYKTGKCFNERTLKRNGDVHSLCEEHRLKQNFIQRRSDRKYQALHAMRRRERSQRKAVFKKQMSMAVAQQLFYEHQQQKNLAVPSYMYEHSAANMTHSNSDSTIPAYTQPGHCSQKSEADPDMSSNFVYNVDTNEDPQESSEQLHYDNDELKANKRGTKRSRATCSEPDMPSHSVKVKNFTSELSNSEGSNKVARMDQSTGYQNDVNETPTGVDGANVNTSSFIAPEVANEPWSPILSTVSISKEFWSEDDLDFLHNALLA